MKIDLAGKVAIVTGAARGIGRAIALGLQKEGVHVLALDLSQDTLEELARDSRYTSPDLRIQACDVRIKSDINAAVSAFGEIHGRIDILVNNAGVAPKAELATMDEEAWTLVHDVNLKGTFLCCQAVLPYMKRQRSGSIINAASFAAISPIFGSGAYASSKAAVAHFTRALAGEVGPWGITANAYAPGMIPTMMNGFAELPAAEQEQLLSTLTLRRWGTPEDIVNLVCFLGSSQASYITGTLIDISGGKLATQIPSLAYDAADDSQ